jgi:hypothetical protein
MAVGRKVTIKRVQAVLNLKSSIPELINQSKGMVKMVTGVAAYSTLSPKITVIGTLTTTLEVTYIGNSTNPPTVSIETRNIAKDNLRNALRSFTNDIQLLADANPAQAKAIITNAGFELKKDASVVRLVDIAKPGMTADSVSLVGKGSGAREWRMSTDGINWLTLPATTSASTTVFNLEPNTEYQFQYRIILPYGKVAEWSDSILYKTK